MCSRVSAPFLLVHLSWEKNCISCGPVGIDIAPVALKTNSFADPIFDPRGKSLI